MDDTLYDYVIPIGMNCDATFVAMKMGVRKKFLPFDWAITPFLSVIELFKNRFDGFMEEGNLLYYDPEPRSLFTDLEVLKIEDKMVRPVMCKRYLILYPHDFEHFEQDKVNVYERVIDRYRRKIETLLEVLDNKNNKVCFIVSIANLSDWQLGKYKVAGADKTLFAYTDELEDKFRKVLSKRYNLTSYDILKLEVRSRGK